MMNFLPYIRLMRPLQWTKNAFVIAPIFFANAYTSTLLWQNALLMMLCFCALSSCIYVINDIVDREEDKKHPSKCQRPIAAGEVSVGSGVFLLSALFVLTVLLAMHFSLRCQIYLLIYLGINLCYSQFLKKIAIIDVLCISAGFVLRVLAGCCAIGVLASPWILLSTFLLALFIAFGKRRSEFDIKQYQAARHSLQEYSVELLDKSITVTCCATMVFYALYAVEVGQAVHGTELIYTVPFVIFGLLRYLWAIYHSELSGTPERLLFKDKLFLSNLIVWFGVTVWVMG